MTDTDVKQLVLELRNKMIDKGYPVRPIHDIRINDSTSFQVRVKYMRIAEILFLFQLL